MTKEDLFIKNKNCENVDRKLVFNYELDGEAIISEIPNATNNEIIIKEL